MRKPYHVNQLSAIGRSECQTGETEQSKFYIETGLQHSITCKLVFATVGTTLNHALRNLLDLGLTAGHKSVLRSCIYQSPSSSTPRRALAMAGEFRRRAARICILLRYYAPPRMTFCTDKTLSGNWPLSL